MLSLERSEKREDKPKTIWKDGIRGVKDEMRFIEEDVGLGRLGVTCSPRDPRFAG